MGSASDAVVLDRKKHVARINALGDRHQFEARRQLGGQVLQAVHGDVDATLGQRIFNLLGEHALGADLRQSDVGDLVAGGLDDLDFDFVSALAQQRRDVVGLPECELRSARTNSEPRHQRLRPRLPAAHSGFLFLGGRV